MHDAADRFTLSPGDDPASTRNQIDQAAKLQLNGGQICINVRMVELERRNDELIRMVVQKFRSFVEERGIVFIAFENKFGSTTEAEAPTKIFRDTADQKIRATAGNRQNPR